MKNVSRKLLLLMSCLILLLSFSPIRHGAAQETGPWMYFSPDPSFIYINGTNQVTVDVMVRDVININAFDIRVDFNPEVVSYVGYEIGDFLKEVYCYPPYLGSGYVQLICTQIAQPGQDGTGSLFRMTFAGVVEGSTILDYTKTVLNEPDGDKVFPGSTDGTLNVVNSANFQYLPLIMNVSVQGVLDRGGIEVALAGLNYGMPYSETSTNIPGNNLDFGDIVVDTYRITTNKARVLNVPPELNKTFTLATGATTVPALRLAAGNAVWTDNVIDIHDLTAVNGAYGDANLNEDADVNFDNLVDGRDLALVGGNWGLTSAVAYAAWLP